MDGQLKRGLLDVCVLSAIKNEDSYGYKIIKDLKEWEAEKMIKELSEKYGEENVKKAFVRLIESVNDDGKPAEWAEDEFKEAVDLKITDGNRPEDLATRQEVAIMIKRAVSK